MADVQELVDRLKDFRTRADAKRELLELGDKAVGPLLAALESSLSGFRWAAISLLGKLRAKKAIPALIEVLRDSEVGSAAAEALHLISGEQFGDDYQAWNQWYQTGGGGGKDGPEAGGLSDADLVSQAVYNSRISAGEKAPGYTFRVPFGDRHQDVFVNFKARDAEGTPLVVIYTVCGESSPKHFEWALRQNVKLSAGAIGIADIEGHAKFIMVDVWKRAAVTPQLLRDCVTRVAEKGDQLEAALSKVDQY